jgi:AraC-like DNA-binding protein
LPTNVSKNEILCYSIMRYIDANIFHIKNFTDISNYFNYNYSYLSKVFKQTTKTTILDYLSSKKLEHAKFLIDEGKLSLTKIAETLNYASIYSFSKSFKYHFGISPSEYKKNLLPNKHHPH